MSTHAGPSSLDTASSRRAGRFRWFSLPALCSTADSDASSPSKSSDAWRHIAARAPHGARCIREEDNEAVATGRGATFKAYGIAIAIVQGPGAEPPLSRLSLHGISPPRPILMSPSRYVTECGETDPADQPPCFPRNFRQGIPAGGLEWAHAKLLAKRASNIGRYRAA